MRVKYVKIGSGEYFMGMEKNETSESSLFSLFLGCLAILGAIALVAVQVLYITFGKSKGLIYSSDMLFFSGCAVALCLIHMSILLFGGRNMKRIFVIVISCIMLVGAVGLIGYGYVHTKAQKSLIRTVSPDKNYAAIFKTDSSSGKIRYYRDFYTLFGKEKEVIPFTSKEKLHCQWVSNDVCAVTGISKDGDIWQYAATFGDRGDGTTYSNMINSLSVEWLASNGKKDTQLEVTKEKIIVNIDGVKEEFDFENCVQYGTLALVLCNEESEAKWMISLNEDAHLDPELLTVEKNGTCSLLKVSMEKEKPIIFTSMGNN